MLQVYILNVALSFCPRCMRCSWRFQCIFFAKVCFLDKMLRETFFCCSGNIIFLKHTALLVICCFSYIFLCCFLCRHVQSFSIKGKLSIQNLPIFLKRSSRTISLKYGRPYNSCILLFLKDPEQAGIRRKRITYASSTNNF